MSDIVKERFAVYLNSEEVFSASQAMDCIEYVSKLENPYAYIFTICKVNVIKLFNYYPADKEKLS